MSLLVVQNSVIPVLRDVPGQSSRLGARHARTVLAPKYMLPWITNQVCIVLTCCIRGGLGQFHLCSFSGPIEVPAVAFGEGDFSTEAETRRQRRSRSAEFSRRLVPLARSASASIDFSCRDHSRVLLEQAFDDGMYRLKRGFPQWHSTAVPQFRCFYFRPLFRRSCYYVQQCDRSPAGESVSFCMC